MADIKMPNINQVGISGRLCQDPEFRVSENGKPRATFSIAVNFNYRDSLGEWKQDATFVPVVVWDKLAEAISEHLRKGSGVFLTGRLRSRTFETEEGNRTILEVVARNIQFLDKIKKEEEQNREEKVPF
jgi:single-strand DNA-binding protein